MKQIINGKIYNTATMTVLAERSIYHNGNYCGSAKLCRTKTGRLAIVHTSNGQDLYRQNHIEALTQNPSDLADALDGWSLSDEEAERLTEYLEEA